MSGNSILVVEDEADIRDMLSFALERGGYAVTEVADAEEALRRLDGPLPDLVIIDWMLPGMSGLDLARRLRRDQLTAELPLIMLTAKGDEGDKLKSFDVGIDDYVTKPFSPRELVARIKAVLRRSGAPEGGQLQFGPLVLDTQSHRLSIGEEHVHIGPTEFRLLEFLMRHPERAFDREQLLDRVWGRSVYVEERTVDVHILRLRKVLAPFELAGWVQTVRGVGYRFSPALVDATGEADGPAGTGSGAAEAG
jgi:two-component system phosphate regulon response regulator PhoB